MTFTSDLVAIVKRELAAADVRFDQSEDVSDCAALYFELLLRRPLPTPRRVHFSEELHTSLGRLKDTSLESWRTVFYIRSLLLQGKDVTSFLSKSVRDLRTVDGLLFDFGIHHFHLSRTRRPGHRFRERSKYLLFAMIRSADAYLVDIRAHRPPAWSAQELLEVVRSNWPKVLQGHALHGQTGDCITDEERSELRRKHVNVVTQLGPMAVAPLGGGMTMAGTSATCRILGDELLHEIWKHQDYVDSDPLELRAQLATISSGASADAPGFCLRLLADLQVSREVLEDLNHPLCLSKRLVELGFVVIESHTQAPLAVRLIES